MTRKIAGVASLATVVATLGFAATGVSGPAHADPGTGSLPPAQGEQQASKPDNRPDPLSRHQSAVRKAAVDDLVNGKAKTVGKGPDRTIQMSDGTQVDYPASQSAELLTFLVQFGDDDYGHAYTGNTAGPLHNTIDHSDPHDNSTYYLPDFNRQHYLDMFFNGLADQGGESFKSVYKEESSGRFDLEGDVSDWVTVPNAASYYQSADGAGEEDGTSMFNFLKDGADAWYQAQITAGKTPAEIKTYLQQFDVWDRFDHDGDGNYNEPDGYIDHFQAIHAGEDESAGAPNWAIWAHRSSTNINEDVGPTGNHNGGLQIGNTGLWIRDYTTEPENGGLGVFAHEFGHDLGLDDYYDTQGGDNSTGFWTLMSQGSWNSHANGNIGTTPNHIGAPDKLFLGWYGDDDVAIVGGTASPQTINLGPDYHATTEGAQAAIVKLPQGQATVDVVEPDGPGTHYFYSGTGDDRVATATSDDTVTVPAGDPNLTARVSYSVEDDFDYAYLQVSTNGEDWDNVETSESTTDDPNLANEGFGITGCSGTRDGDGVCDLDWVDLDADLSAYAGQDVQLRWEMVNDPGYHEIGFSVDSISVGGNLVTDVEDGGEGWTLDGFRVMDGASYVNVYTQYYMAENKQRFGYQKTLFQGPYSFDYATSAPNKVDHFSYNDGLLIWYVNGLYSDNNVSAHPGGGEALVVDSNPQHVYWTKADGTRGGPGSGNLNSFDSTFDVDQTEALHLTRESTNGVHFDVAAHPSVPVFEDSDVDAYFDPTVTGRQGWYSTEVAGIGTEIQVLSSDETTGHMQIKVGRKFVAATSGALITGALTAGSTLTAVAPHYFQPGVAAAYQWNLDGAAIAGATSSTYQVRSSDVGKSVTVTVTGTKAGYLPSTVTAPAATAGVSSAATTMKVDAPKKVKKGKKATITVTVSAPGLTPAGMVQVTYGGKAVPAQALADGTVKITLPKQKKTGKKTLVVTYVPATGFTGATQTLTVRIISKKK